MKINSAFSSSGTNNHRSHRFIYHHPTFWPVLLLLGLAVSALTMGQWWARTVRASLGGESKSSVALSSITPASTIVVNSLSDAAYSSDGLCTLREAIAAANQDTAPGTVPGECAAGNGADTIDMTGVTGTISLNAALPQIDKPVTITGPGASQLTVTRPKGSGAYRIFTFSNGPSAVSGVTVSNGATGRTDIYHSPTVSDPGAGIFNSGSLTLTDVVITGNRAGKGPTGSGNRGGTGGSGGGIYNTGTLTMTNCYLTDNFAGDGGIGAAHGGDGGWGGGIYSSGTLTMTNCHVTGNRAGNSLRVSDQGYGGSGGGIYSSGTLLMIDCSVNDNRAGESPLGPEYAHGGDGGGIYVSGTSTMSNCSVNGNATGSGAAGGNGGGIANYGSTLTMTDSMVSGNRTGATFEYYRVVRATKAGDGGGIYTTGTLVLGTTTISNNVTGDNGGTSTSLAGDGGGIYNQGHTSLTDCTVSGNSTGGVSGTRGFGGGIDNEQYMSIVGTTISGNADTTGGAILNRRNLFMTNSTVSDNHSSYGIHNQSTTNSLTIVMITNCTVATNDGVGAAIGGYSVSSVRNSMVAANANGDVSGSWTSLGHNLIGNADGSTGFTNGSNSDQVGTTASPIDPRLSSLANNGGPTQTLALLAGSPAIDAGDNCVLTDTCSSALGFPLVTDQRGTGFNRGNNGAVDIGAFESRGAQTISFGALANKIFGAPDFTVSATASSGLLTSFAASGQCSVSGATVHLTGVGTCSITASQMGDGNFNAAPDVTQSFAIAHASVIAFSESNYTLNESNECLIVTVKRSGDLTIPVTVDYATDDSGAVVNCQPLSGNQLASSRCDFGLTLGTLSFAANEAQKTFEIPITQDSYAEGPEMFTVNLSNPTGSSVGLGTPSSAVITINDSTMTTPNAIDDTEAFVCMQYHDFLNREPDAAGLAFWVDNIDKCNDPARRPAGLTTAQCIEVMRINTSAAFFSSIEFQGTGNLVRSFYVAALDRPLTNNMPGFVEFERDTQTMQRGLIVGQDGWQQKLDQNRDAFMKDFVTRPEFIALYPTTDRPWEYVNKLFVHAGIIPAPGDRDAAIAEFRGAPIAADPLARGRALLAVTQHPEFQNREMNRSFVQMQYFGYLRRNPSDLPDQNCAGYDFWLNKLNDASGNSISCEMVKAFLHSSEYRQRFGR